LITLKPLIVTVLIGSVIAACSAGTDDPRLQLQSPTPSPSIPDGAATRTYDEMLKVVADLSKQTGIANLKAAKLAAGQTEIRIWKGLGLVTPRCFRIVRSRRRSADTGNEEPFRSHVGLFR